MSERQQHYFHLISYYPIALKKGWKRPSYSEFIWCGKKSLIAFSWLKARKRVASLKDSLSSHTKAHFQSPREHGRDLWLQCPRSKWNVFFFSSMAWKQALTVMRIENALWRGEITCSPLFSPPPPAACCFVHFVVVWDMPQTYISVSGGREGNKDVGLKLYKGERKSNKDAGTQRNKKAGFRGINFGGEWYSCPCWDFSVGTVPTQGCQVLQYFPWGEI